MRHTQWRNEISRCGLAVHELVDKLDDSITQRTQVITKSDTRGSLGLSAGVMFATSAVGPRGDTTSPSGTANPWVFRGLEIN